MLVFKEGAQKTRDAPLDPKLGSMLAGSLKKVTLH